MLRFFILAGISLPLLAGSLWGAEKKKASTPRIACSLAADDVPERAAEIVALFEAQEEIRELEDGYAFRFPGDAEWAGKLLELIESERQCCPFFKFELSFEPNQGPIWFHVRGSEQAKAFVELLMQ